MEIILKEDIIGLGYKNDIVNVKAGYGRNYLIPKGKGVIASESAKKQLAETLKQQVNKLAKLKAAAEERGAQLKDIALTIAAKVSSSGTTYGSVGPAQVAEALKKLGIDIDRKIITMHEAKKIGDYIATVHFHKEVEVEIPVKVVPDEESRAQTKAEADARAEQKAADEARQEALKAKDETKEADAESENDGDEEERGNDSAETEKSAK